MRHKQTSVSLTKLRGKFEQSASDMDPPYAILSPFKGKSKLLLKSHFETQVGLLLNETKVEPYHFVLQKYVSPCRDALHICTYSQGEVTLQTTQYSQEFLINGLYSKASIAEPQGSDYIDQKLREKTMRVVSFLKLKFRELSNVKVTWICNDQGQLWLLNISDLLEGTIQAQPKPKAAYDLNLSFTRRPTSARLVQRPSTNASFTYGARNDSVPRPPRTSFKVSPRTQLLSRKENASSEPRIRVKDVPILEKQDLSKEDPKTTASSRDSSDASSEFWRKGYRDLEKQMSDMKELHALQLKELDQQWRAKCATLYTELMSRSEAEKAKLQQRVVELQRQLDKSKEEEYKVEVFHNANHR